MRPVVWTAVSVPILDPLRVNVAVKFVDVAEPKRDTSIPNGLMVLADHTMSPAVKVEPEYVPIVKG